MSTICRLREWLGDDNVRYFRLLKSLTGSYSPTLKLNMKRKGRPAHSIHFNEGRQVRNWMINQPEFKDWDSDRLDDYWVILVERMCRHYRSSTWVELDNSPMMDNDYSTYPSEGIDVIASDDNGNEETLYFLMSGEYVWMKPTFDDATRFKDFIPTKWKTI